MKMRMTASAFFVLAATTVWLGGQASVAFQVRPSRTLLSSSSRGTSSTRLFAVSSEKDQEKSIEAAPLPYDLHKSAVIDIKDEIGSGSYGTVHKAAPRGQDEPMFVVKRPWSASEVNATANSSAKDRAARCRYYWTVESHCLGKLPPHPQLPPYYGIRKDEQKREWMVFGAVGGRSDAVAPTLSDVMKEDYRDHATSLDLPHLSEAFGKGDTHEEVLDRVLESLLNVLSHIHKNKIIHRDIKPANLLVHDGKLVLIDFGSAADLDKPGPGRRRVGLENGSRVAVSPVYCAPEIFINVHDHPTEFDVFSTGLLFCQLLFTYLEDRMDAGFHQQLEEVSWDVNAWLDKELASKVRPRGLVEALDYLADRPGLWTLLEHMLAAKPADRPTSGEALRRFRAIMKQREALYGMVETKDGLKIKDGPFFTMVVESMEMCEIPSISQPLHYVATFERKLPLGLVLAEMDADIEEDGFAEDDSQQADEKLRKWKEATKDAYLGEVFIRDIVPGGQADELGVFEIGDRLQGIGELPFSDEGFEKAVSMLKNQPRRLKTVKLHFDRQSVRKNEAIPMDPSSEVNIDVVDRGAWSAVGKRHAQEDAFVLHEIHDTSDRSVLIAGVFDGHGGRAASSMASEALPDRLSEELLDDKKSLVRDALAAAWDDVCVEYRTGCDGDSCSAEYDEREGLLMASTGSADMVAGTTASVFALDEKSGDLTAMNCGDSRCIVVTPPKKEEDGKDADSSKRQKVSVAFATRDHTPEAEEERLMAGIEAGLDYALPKCEVARQWLSVGDYAYSVARSLEGSMATSKGIISDPDLTTFRVRPGAILVSATDGLWDVMDNMEVARDVSAMRWNDGMSARDASRSLCSMALKKGTLDNVSAVVVYL